MRFCSIFGAVLREFFFLRCCIAVVQNQAVCGIQKFAANFNAVYSFLMLFCAVFIHICVRFCRVFVAPLRPPHQHVFPFFCMVAKRASPILKASKITFDALKRLLLTVLGSHSGDLSGSSISSSHAWSNVNEQGPFKRLSFQANLFLRLLFYGDKLNLQNCHRSANQRIVYGPITSFLSALCRIFIRSFICSLGLAIFRRYLRCLTSALNAFIHELGQLPKGTTFIKTINKSGVLVGKLEFSPQEFGLGFGQSIGTFSDCCHQIWYSRLCVSARFVLW